MSRWIWWMVVMVLLGLAALGFIRRKALQAVAKQAPVAPATLNRAGASPGAGADAAAPLTRPIGFGLTFGVAESPQLPSDTASLSCQGEPQAVDRPLKEACNPVQGDTSCRTVLPVLCAKVMDVDAPATADPGLYRGWMRGSLGATQPVMGAILESAAATSALCEKELGAGWRMAEFVEGSGVWALQGRRGLGLGGNNRYWVHAAGKGANCWNSPP